MKAERFSEALTSKLWNKKTHAAKAYKNRAKLNMFTPYGFIKNLQQIHLKDSHIMKFMRKNKAIPCDQNNMAWLVKNCKTAFSKLTKIYLPVSGKQMSRQASTQPLVLLSQIFTYILSSLLHCYFSGTSILFFSFWANVSWILNKYFYFLLKFATTTFMYHSNTFRHLFPSIFFQYLAITFIKNELI